MKSYIILSKMRKYIIVNRIDRESPESGLYGYMFNNISGYPFFLYILGSFAGHKYQLNRNSKLIDFC